MRSWKSLVVWSSVLPSRVRTPSTGSISRVKLPSISQPMPCPLTVCLPAASVVVSEAEKSFCTESGSAA